MKMLKDTETLWYVRSAYFGLLTADYGDRYIRALTPVMRAKKLQQSTLSEHTA